ncbi:phosphate starvation-inducible protein PsiF [Luteibacter flocculans]|uniref:Phosphate starvation-inducible protein PsiF n=1 Tax=Luteibacter flocculans TaxID=2780091 RepID=A0ABY4T3H7_9GAMM|nr:PsiF family protein [Luteibacter flocculans]URL59477.1 phosphate starvation-inducible protein PsiF [Luteibacter flocculans]
MRTQIRVLAAVSLLVFAAATVAAPQTPAKKELTPQQQRMSTCNTQAAGKKGDERKTFMSSCLKGEAPAKTSQQDKMKSCNKDASAKSLKGDERKQFMSTCLKG